MLEALNSLGAVISALVVIYGGYLAIGYAMFPAASPRPGAQSEDEHSPYYVARGGFHS